MADGNEAGRSRLMSSMGMYTKEASGGGLGKTPGVIEPDKGFELKAGSRNGASGPALPLSTGPGMEYNEEPSAGEEDEGEAEQKASMESSDDPKGGFSDPAGSSDNDGD
jgi:hypothetical protein